MALILVRFRSVSRELRRLSSSSRAPIMSAMSEALNGATSIRAYKKEKHFIDSFCDKVDHNVMAEYPGRGSRVWLSVRLDCISIVAGIAVVIMCVVSNACEDSGEEGSFLSSLSAFAGIALLYVFSLPNTLAATVTSYVDCETEMNAVERIVEYINGPKEGVEMDDYRDLTAGDDNTESAAESEDSKLGYAVKPLSESVLSPDNTIMYLVSKSKHKNKQDDKEKPIATNTNTNSDTVISLVDVSFRYRRNLPLVLQHITADIPRGKRVSIIGRTGSGKSSLVNVLTHMSSYMGNIYMNGVELRDIGVRKLRCDFSVVTQDPVIFSGSIRANLDPLQLLFEDIVRTGGYNVDCANMDAFDIRKKRKGRKGYKKLELNQVSGKERRVLCLFREDFRSLERVGRRLGRTTYTDERMWEVLDMVQLKQKFCNTKEGLSTALKDKGSNLSAGERQLMCLAKAIIRDANVVVMDEATAQVDTATDEIIQQVIRTRFAGKTLICIAHRLNTIIDFDYVVCLDKGEIVEFDTPQRLLQDENSLLSSLCRETGKENEEALRRKCFAFQGR